MHYYSHIETLRISYPKVDIHDALSRRCNKVFQNKSKDPSPVKVSKSDSISETSALHKSDYMKTA